MKQQDDKAGNEKNLQTNRKNLWKKLLDDKEKK